MSDTVATQARQDVVANVDEIIEHVINANMLSMPYEVYSELFDAVDGLGVEIENLQVENAKLRELAGDMWCCISHIGEYDIFYYDMAEDGCGMSCTVNGEHCCADKLRDRMRELGVGVD